MRKNQFTSLDELFNYDNITHVMMFLSKICYGVELLILLATTLPIDMV